MFHHQRGHKISLTGQPHSCWRACSRPKVNDPVFQLAVLPYITKALKGAPFVQHCTLASSMALLLHQCGKKCQIPSLYLYTPIFLYLYRPQHIGSTVRIFCMYCIKTELQVSIGLCIKRSAIHVESSNHLGPQSLQ